MRESRPCSPEKLAAKGTGLDSRRTVQALAEAWRWGLPAIDAETKGAIDALPKSVSAYAFYDHGEHLCDEVEDAHADSKDAHVEAIECIDAHVFAPQPLEHQCHRCDGEGCKWCES